LIDQALAASQTPCWTWRPASRPRTASSVSRLREAQIPERVLAASGS
jgi:hypothetical protein